MGAGSRFFGSVSVSSALVISLVIAGFTPVSAQESGDQESSESANAVRLLTLAEIFPAPELLSLDVVGSLNVDPYRLGIDDLIQARVELEAGQLQMADAMFRYSRSVSAIADGLVDEADALQTHTEATELAEAAEQNLKGFAIGAFSGSELRDLEHSVFAGKLTPLLTLQSSVEDRVLNVKQIADTELSAAEIFLDKARAELTTQRTKRDLAEQNLESAQDQIDAATTQIGELSGAAERRLATTKDPELGFTVIALDSYYNAEQLMATADPGCGVQWWQLAGIGRVESIHGTHGGAKVKVSGVTTRKILGPPLDGEEFLAIPDSDGGELDGDLEWDRAVGPMQFIPGSWRIFKADGDGDGRSNPHNMYDATLAAAKHLCNSVRNITDAGRFRRALLDYNRSGEYGATVQRFAATYVAEIDLVSAGKPAAEQKPFCVPQANEIKALPLSGCGAVGGPGGRT